MPAHRRTKKGRTHHLGTQVNQRGGVRALCYTVPRSIDMRRGTWTQDESAVTCPNCLKIIASAKARKES